MAEDIYNSQWTGAQIDEAIGTVRENSGAWNYANIAYAACTTAAATAAKTAAISGNTGWKLQAGSIVCVKFTYTNTANNPTLNVGGTGAKAIYFRGSALSGNISMIRAGDTAVFVYNGTQYELVSVSSAGYNPSCGTGYGDCSTAEATTAKTATLFSYELMVCGITAINFTYAVPANATLNINGKGAKAIRYRGAAITAGVISAGDIATFIYDGSYYQLLAVDSAAGRKPVLRTISLPASGWDSANMQPVDVAGVLGDETAQLVQVMPAIVSQAAYIAAGILCTDQAADVLIFTADTVPEEDLTVFAVLQEVSE